MTMRDLALQGMETTLNTLIDLDGRAAARLQPDHGRVVAIALRGTSLAFYFIPDQNGHLQLFGDYEAGAECTIEGSPLDLMRASDKSQSSAQLFGGHISLSGDTELGHRFSDTLGSLNIDWEEQLAKLIGDVAAHEVGRGTRDAVNEGQRISGLMQQNLSEYLTEEARLLPHRYEVEEWLHDIDTLRDDVERLQARVALLEHKAAGEQA